MASKTNQSWVRRELRRANAGKARKAALRNKGTTPPFAVHTPDADANAPIEQLSPSARAIKA